MKQVIRSQYNSYPLSTIRDIVKLIYQNEFAGGHLITDERASFELLEREMQGAASEDAASGFAPEAVFEEIGNHLCRLNLRAALQTGVSTATINRIFIYTANHRTGSTESFQQKLGMFRELCEDGELPFDTQEIDQYIGQYAKDGFPAVSHSEEYRLAYNPSYRVVDQAFHQYFDLFVRLDGLLRSDSPSLIAAIDGNSGAGKSWLSGLIGSIYSCNLFHADDFFLRPEQRTQARLAEPGGNVDYERLESEIYAQIAEDRSFKYRKFDCSVMALGDTVQVAPCRLNIIEGSYSLHPNLSKYCDLRIFLKISAADQAERILRRNGPILYQRFAEEWIPKENLYFRTFSIEQNCDLVFAA
ncbi:MAG: uridine kinase family protein [Saccharofermentanales bacterium]